MTERWIGLELRHLATLRAIAEEGSFKAAARVLGYTPSAVSQQIASLERVVGVQVIAREQGRQALGLTEAGRILLLHLTDVEARLGVAKTEIDALARGASGTLRVGAYESVGSRLLPEVLVRFRETFPEHRVDVDESLSDLDHLRGLERGTLDLAFTLLPVPPGPFHTRSVLRDPWVLVVQPDSEHARSIASPTLRSVAQLPLACFRAPRAIEAALRPFYDAGLEPNFVLRSDYNDAVQEFAASGRGVSFMPRLAVNARDDRTAIVPLGDLVPPREIALAWHESRLPSVAVELFVTLSAEVGARLQKQSRHSSDLEPGPLRASA